MMTPSRRASLGMLTAIAGLVFALPALAGLAVTSERQVAFHAIGPAGLGIDGTGNDIKLDESAAAIDMFVGLKSLNTGIALRDRHMKEKYLETQKYPIAKLHVQKSNIRFPSGGGTVNAEGMGLLTLHGVTKRVPFHYAATGTEHSARVDGHLHVNMKEFGIEVPSYLGVTVKPNVEVRVKFGIAG
jgi:polyisoprenoid-binding protein YceI